MAALCDCSNTSAVRKQKYDPDYMLRQLDSLYRSHGMCRPGLLRLGEQLPSSRYFGRQFGSLDHAFQKLFDSERDLAREKVHEQIRSHVPEVLSYSDFLVLDNKLTLSVQRAVPVPHGYDTYWPLSCDTRPVCDRSGYVLNRATVDQRQCRIREDSQESKISRHEYPGVASNVRKKHPHSQRVHAPAGNVQKVNGQRKASQKSSQTA